jgi:hypothetical protein
MVAHGLNIESSIPQNGASTPLGDGAIDTVRTAALYYIIMKPRHQRCKD